MYLWKQGGHVVVGFVPVILAPRVEAFGTAPAEAQHGVHDEKPVEPIGHVLRDRQAQKAAPILHHQRDVQQIECFDQGNEALAMEVEGVDRILNRFVGSPEPEEVRGHDPRPGVEEDRDHVAVQKAPRWLPVETQEHAVRIPGPFVNARHSEPFISGQRVAVMGFPWKIRDVRKAFIRGSDRVDVGHAASPDRADTANREAPGTSRV
jgi:hypothetical protein